MMTDRRTRNREAVRAAFKARRLVKAGRTDPVCVFDAASDLGLEVKFRPEPSLEGMYIRGSRGVILVGTQRPRGRRAYSCAHELGHHYLGHGTRVDEYLEGSSEAKRKSPEEQAADLFAAYFLMPRNAVERAFAKRGRAASLADTTTTYAVSCELGVGYASLVTHMTYSLKMISREHSQELLKLTPKKYRCQVLGKDPRSELIIVDLLWDTVPIDLRVNNLVLLPPGAVVEGGNMQLVGPHGAGTLAQAARQGKGRVTCGDTDWAAFTRVSREDYFGRSMFRHLEDPDEHG